MFENSEIYLLWVVLDINFPAIFENVIQKVYYNSNQIYDSEWRLEFIDQADEEQTSEFSVDQCLVPEFWNFDEIAIAVGQIQDVL
jgi:hypothetical protein